MELFEIEAQLKKLQEEYHNTALLEIKQTLKAIHEQEGCEEDISFNQRQHLIDLISANSSAWSGGAASITNVTEAMVRDIAIDLMKSLNRGLLDL